MGKSRNNRNRQNNEVNPENPESNVDEAETEVFEGEVIDPEELEGEETEDVKAKVPKKKKKKGFFKKAGAVVKDKLEDVTLWDVVKGVGLFAGGVGVGVLGMIALGSRDSSDDGRPGLPSECPEDRKVTFVDDEEETPFDD